MKKLFYPTLSFLLLALSYSSFACEKYALWVETPAIGTTQENQKLFNKIRHTVQATLEAKNYELIPYGTYTRDLTKKNFCEITVEVTEGKRSKLNADIRIEEFEYDMSEVTFRAQGEMIKVLESLPLAL